VSADFHSIGLGLLTVGSILSLLFLLAKALSKEFQTVALAWIRAFRRIQAEWRKPVNDLTSQPPKLLERTRSRRG
jgi:hypothetical protein